jgi:hypothetical protein
LRAVLAGRGDFGMTAVRSDGFVRAAADASRMITAIHESGHAVVARSLSAEVTRLDLKFCHTRRRDDPITCWSQAVVACGDPIAELRFAGYPPERVALLERSAWAPDRRNAAYWLRQLDDSGAAPFKATLEQAQNMAAHLVDQHWDAIIRVAQALAAEGELSGARIEALRAL